MKPLQSKQYTTNHLLNPNRPYVSAAATDVAATFARIRAEQAKPPKKSKVFKFRGE